MPKPAFTVPQQDAIGGLVSAYWGANIQTGYEDGGDTPVLWAQLGPNLPVMSWTIEPDGTVTLREG